MSATNADPDIAAMVVKAQKDEAEAAARAALAQADYLSSVGLQQLTGIPASTWRYWVMTGRGPRSFKAGRRRLYKRSDVLAWLAAQEAATGTGGGAA